MVHIDLKQTKTHICFGLFIYLFHIYSLDDLKFDLFLPSWFLEVHFTNVQFICSLDANSVISISAWVLQTPFNIFSLQLRCMLLCQSIHKF